MGYILPGVDRAAYPQDFASNMRFHDDLSKLGGPVRPRIPGWPRIRDQLDRLGV